MLWKKFWKLNIPPKIKNFMWRTLTGVLPTAESLRTHMVKIETTCPICYQERESAHHLLLWCHIAQQCWRLTPLSLPCRDDSVLSWIYRIFEICSFDIACQAIMICWTLWINRNNIVWKNHKWSPMQILTTANRRFTQWNEAQRVRLRVNDTVCHFQRQPTIWERPVDGMLKLNVNAALFSAKGLVGVGCVPRDSTGNFITAKATTENLQVQPHEAKAVGVREALSWIKHDNKLNIIVEMDAKLVYDALSTFPISNSPFRIIIEDCKEMATSLYVNSAAHVVARALFPV